VGRYNPKYYADDYAENCRHSEQQQSVLKPSLRYDLYGYGLAVLVRVSKLEGKHRVNIGYELISARRMALPQRAEIRHCLWVLSDPRTARKKRLRTALSRNPLENKPVYDNDKEDQNYRVYEPFQKKGAKGRFSHREDRRSSFYLVLASVHFLEHVLNPLRRIPRKRELRPFFASPLAVVPAVGIG